MGFQLPTSTGFHAGFLPSVPLPGLGSTLHGRLCWSRGTLSCAGGRWTGWLQVGDVSRPMGIMSCDGMICEAEGSFGQEIVQECTKGYGTTQGGWAAESASSIRLCRAAMVWEAYVQGAVWNGFLRSDIRDAAKAKGHTGRWRRSRGRWGRGNFSKTRLTVLYWRDCCLYSWEATYFPFQPALLSRWFSFSQGGIWIPSLKGKVSLSESNSWCASGWWCWELWHGDCRFGKIKPTWLFRFFQGFILAKYMGIIISKPWNKDPVLNNQDDSWKFIPPVTTWGGMRRRGRVWRGHGAR